MKNLKNTILPFVGCVLLSALVSIDAKAQTKSNWFQKTSAKIIKCKDNDSDCFIRAAKTCRKATLQMDKPPIGLWNPNAPHPTYAQTLRYEIKGEKNGKCTFYSKIEKSDVQYSEDFILFAMKDRGITRQEVEKELSEERQAYQRLAGRDGVCLFQTKKLVDILNGWWQKGGGYKFSTKDFEGADCQGTLYNFTLPNQTIKSSELLDNY